MERSVSPSLDPSVPHVFSPADRDVPDARRSDLTCPDSRASLGSARFRPEALARNLAHGAMLELRLTPKPGLVDLRTCGSHPDLTVESMTRSASLLPAYFRELLEAERRGRGFRACVEAGRRAENRMLFAIGSNAHRGYIFLAGLILLASCREGDGPGDLRVNCAQLAEEFFHTPAERSNAPREDTPGSRARRDHALGGVRAEALSGLPSVFEVGWPAFVKHLADSGDFVRASHYALARLMQKVEDTTAVHRGGLAGLARIRHDGGLLQRVLEEKGDHLSLLERLDAEYTKIGLTMGGVADCLGLTYAVYLTTARKTEAEVGDIQALLLNRRHGKNRRLP
jgi:triphosphoribosyl-dephospho-CoA synthetase